MIWIMRCCAIFKQGTDRVSTISDHETKPDDALARVNVLRLAAAQALAGANSIVIMTTGAIVGSMLAPSLVDSVLALGRTATDGHSAAVVRRMRLQPAGHGAPETAAEVFGCFSRGGRIHAIACRVEQVPSDGGTRWQVVALHIG